VIFDSIFKLKFTRRRCVM